VPLVTGHHGGQKRLHRVPVAENVDGEEVLEEVVRGVENGVGGHDARIVDEDTGVAQLLSDPVCRGVDLCRVGDVAGEELDVCVWWRSLVSCWPGRVWYGNSQPRRLSGNS